MPRKTGKDFMSLIFINIVGTSYITKIIADIITDATAALNLKLTGTTSDIVKHTIKNVSINSEFIKTICLVTKNSTP